MRLAEFVGPQAQHDVDSPTTGYDKLVLSADWTRSSGSIETGTSGQNTIILQRKLRLAHRWRESVALIEYPETASQRLDDARAHPNVVAAIPAFNEGPTIGSVVLKARQFASEVVVVDDGSTDDTAETATLAGAHVIRHARNLGNREVNIDARYDLDGSTLAPDKHGTSVLGRTITLVSEKRPLFFFGVSGALLLLVAAALGVILLQIYYASRAFAIGYAFIVVLFGIVGILSVFIGITLNAIRRTAAR